VKFSKAQVQRRVHALPLCRFEDQALTSSAGLVLYEALFQSLNLRRRLRGCFNHLVQWPIYAHVDLFLSLVVHVLLGYRNLRETAYYREDPMVLRVLGWQHLPDVSTYSRRLATMDLPACGEVARLNREIVLDRLIEAALARVTLDFDGSVLTSRRHAEGTAVGFNRARKGERSYYPLLCTVAQTGQILDVLHRSGNVHDSNGAGDFIEACVIGTAERLGHVTVESRLDSAFFSENTVLVLDSLDVQYTVSVPFDRLAEIKKLIEGRRRWRRLDATWSYFELAWGPKCWLKPRRLLIARQQAKERRKGTLQLDLFCPSVIGYEYTAVLTNKHQSAKTVLAFHHGRGAQEGVFGEVKQDCQLGYIPARTWAANRMYLYAAIVAHNLTRELQMRSLPRRPAATAGRAALWTFQKLSTLRALLIRRAGRLTNNSGTAVLTMSANGTVQGHFEHLLEGAIAA
jgi:hypothetical protein